MPLPRPAPGTLKWWVVGTIGIGLGVALAVWFGLSATVGLPAWQTMGFKVVDNRSVWVDFEVYSPGGKDVTCTVHALSRDFAVVGSTEVPVELGGVDTVRRQVTVRTTSLAVTGAVDSCSVTR
ncbi:DUF4307 domain-containing protein [Intrasporangium calvum]|uniref:DUF4307 domain-containing protein n=1 Tax=Intrasporangium calvum TaxID=53358 RepID=A0ABT5GGU5_9MICO|nr:DUF4307 domain-containing protein [Intrasporangium calvum]MDC5696931.1 DUF4307 domain-containing protein [Intrasporangium calvum]